MEKPKVLVLMCTYNGEKYLNEQIDSILAQKDVDVYIKVADDCSSDSTVNILESYKTRYNNFDYYVNQSNKNFTYNFIDLLFSVKETNYDYYAFSDQDDFWLENKLISAIQKIGQSGENGKLYCSNLRLVDKILVEYGIQEKKNILKTDKYNYLVANIATGCTIVFDSKFLIHATKYYPENIKLHDYWLLLIAAFTAEYVYDFESYILYRQHGNNQIGSNKKFFTRKKIYNFFHTVGAQHQLISQLLCGYSDFIDDNDIKVLTMTRDYKIKLSYKIKLLFSRRVKRYKYNFLFKIKVLLNKY